MYHFHNHASEPTPFQYCTQSATLRVIGIQNMAKRAKKSLLNWEHIYNVWQIPVILGILEKNILNFNQLVDILNIEV